MKNLKTRKIKKYANSLIKVSNQLDNDIKDIINNLFLFKKLVREIPELRYLLFSKRISIDTKLSAIKNIFSNYFEVIELEFIFRLLKDGQISIMTDITDKLHSIVQSDSNTKNIDIVSSKQLDDSEKNEIIESIKRKFKINNFSETSFSVDNKILGGIKIRIGNKIIDGSVSTKLKKIKESLLSV